MLHDNLVQPNHFQLKNLRQNIKKKKLTIEGIRIENNNHECKRQTNKQSLTENSSYFSFKSFLKTNIFTFSRKLTKM